MDDPGKFISGLTQEQVDADPEIAAFLQANFQDSDNQDARGRAQAVNYGITVPKEVLEQFGLTEEEAHAMLSPSSKPTRQYGDPHVDKGLGTEEQQRLNIRVLRSHVRVEEGTRPSVRLRRQAWIPGVLYGGDPRVGMLSRDPSSRLLLKTPWSELQRELDRFHRQFESRVYDLTIYEDETDTDGTVHRVVPRNVQRHPVQGKIYCSNFLRYHPKRPLKIPLMYINKEESPALKRDGFIIPINKYVECFVEDGVPIPENLEVECTGLVLKDVVRMDRVIFPDGVRHTDRTNVETFVVGPVNGGRSAAMEDDDEEGSTEEAAES